MYSSGRGSSAHGSPFASGAASGMASNATLPGGSMRSQGPGPSFAGSGHLRSLSGLPSDGEESPEAMAHWQTMVDSGWITDQVQVHISKLLDLPREFRDGRPLRYNLLASDEEKVLGKLEKLGGKAPAQEKKETFSLSEEGMLRLATRSVGILIELQYEDGRRIARCSLSRMDPRSAKPNTYSCWENEGSDVPICGVELTIFEGAQELEKTTLPERAAPTSSPRGPPPDFPPGAGQSQSQPSKEPTSQDISFDPPPLARSGVPPPPPLPTPGMPALGREVAVKVSRLLDVPSRPQKNYVVRVLDPLGQLAATPEVPSEAGGAAVSTVHLGPEGDLALRTESPLLTVRVEFSDGLLIGSCQIYRPDPRSEKMSQYLLTDAAGGSADCGVELQVLEAVKASRHMGGNLPAGSRVVGRLQLRVLGAFNLQLRDRNVLPAVFVQASVGKTMQKTLIAEGSLSPVWPSSNEFTFPVGAEDGELEIKVMNSSVPANQVLGSLGLALWNVPPAQWLQRREKLVGGAGELEYAFFFQPAKVSTEVPQPGTAPKAMPEAPPAPPSGLAGPTAGSYGGPALIAPLHFGPQIPFGEPPPGSMVAGDLVLPPLTAGWEAFKPVPRAPQALRSLPAPPTKEEPRMEEHQALFPDMFHYEKDEHEAEELWLKPPEHDKADELLGADRDFEVLASTAEKWRAPVLTPVQLDVFHDKVFPDMDVSLVLPQQAKKELMPAREVKTRRKERRDRGLPEIPVDGWDNAQSKQTRQPLALRQLKDQERKQTPPPQAGLQEPKTKWISPILEARSKRRRAKLKVERELVRPEQALDIEQQLQSPEMICLDPALQPQQYKAQVVSHLEPEDEERRVWVRRPGSDPTVMEVPKDDQQWLEPFQTSEETAESTAGRSSFQLGISSLRGKRGSTDPLPCQDCLSLTRYDEDILYVLCDGHGPFGHLVAFRVAQSLPWFLEQLLAAGHRPEEALVHAFPKVAEDVAQFGKAKYIDISSSGASCSVAFRHGDEVKVAWLGDTRVLVATVTETSRRVDLVTPAHTTEDVKELQRARNSGAKLVQVPPNSGHVRLFVPGERYPGLFVTRAFGDLAGQGLGVSSQPEIRKTSFERTPGLVLLGSGGFWEMLDDARPGEEALQLLTACRLKECGPSFAAGKLAAEARSRWQQTAEDCSDDVSCILLHWIPGQGGSRGTAPTAPRPMPQEDSALAPDTSLCPKEFDRQLLSTVEASSGSSGAWLRSPLSDHRISLKRLDAAGLAEALPSFQAGRAQACFCSRRGVEPSKDCFSITQRAGRTLYLVCNGFGPAGHLVSFRVAQSLPKFLFEASTEEVPEQLVALAFHAAAAELSQFAGAAHCDLSQSGASVAALLQQGDSVHLAWLGESRVLVATIAGQFSRVDLLSPTHLQPDGLQLSRAFGHSASNSTRPDLAKTSFDSTPGLVLLGSGSLFESMSGEDAVEVLQETPLTAAVAGTALKKLCDKWQQTWDGKKSLLCFLLIWPGEETRAESPKSLSPMSPSRSAQAALLAGKARYLQAKPESGAVGQACPEAPTPPQPASPKAEPYHCPNCGTLNPATARFCKNCGHKRPEATSLTTPAPAGVPTAAAKPPTDSPSSRAPEPSRSAGIGIGRQSEAISGPRIPSPPFAPAVPAPSLAAVASKRLDAAQRYALAAGGIRTPQFAPVRPNQGLKNG